MSIDRRRFLQSTGLAAAGLCAGIGTGIRPAVAEELQDSPERNIKITGYRTRVLDNIDPPIGHRKWLFLELETDAGTWRAMHTPGHAPGHLCLHSRQANCIVAGEFSWSLCCAFSGFWWDELLGVVATRFNGTGIRVR